MDEGYVIKKLDSMAEDISEIKTTQAVQTLILEGQQKSIDTHIKRTNILQEEVTKILTLKAFVVNLSLFLLKVAAVGLTAAGLIWGIISHIKI